MSLSVQPSTLAIRPNRSYNFGPVGGVAPYTWTLSQNNSGGSINASTGAYTAGPDFGVDVIQVTDSTTPTPLTATATVGVDTVLQLLGDIIANYLGLSPDQYWLWDQKVDIPNDSRLYVILSVVSEKAFGQTNSHDGGSSDGDPLTSVQSVNIMARFGIDILSRGTSARDMKDQVLLALNSDYAEAQQELNSFFLGKGPTSFVNLSQVDGAAIPYRFHIEVNVQYAVSNAIVVPSFDSYDTPEVTTEP
jgi:hypothetical protein